MGCKYITYLGFLHCTFVATTVVAGPFVQNCRIESHNLSPSVFFDSVNKVQFANIPKCGSSTIRHILTRQSPFGGNVRRSSGKWPPTAYWPTKPVGKDEAPNFVAFVRDPVARFVSAFKEVKKRFPKSKTNTDDCFAALLATLLDGTTFSHEGLSVMNQCFVRIATDDLKSEKFKAWGKVVFDHMRSQVSILFDKQGNPLPITIVGRVDSMSLDWDTSIIDAIPGFVPLAQTPNMTSVKRWNVAINDKAKTYTVTMTTIVVRRICKLYIADYCCLGIKVPPICSSLCNQGSSMPYAHDKNIEPM